MPTFLLCVREHLKVVTTRVTHQKRYPLFSPEVCPAICPLPKSHHVPRPLITLQAIHQHKKKYPHPINLSNFFPSDASSSCVCISCWPLFLNGFLQYILFLLSPTFWHTMSFHCLDGLIALKSHAAWRVADTPFCFHFSPPC